MTVANSCRCEYCERNEVLRQLRDYGGCGFREPPSAVWILTGEPSQESCGVNSVDPSVEGCGRSDAQPTLGEHFVPTVLEGGVPGAQVVDGSTKRFERITERRSQFTLTKKGF